MRKWVLVVLALLLLASAVFFAFLPGYLAAQMNRVIDHEPYAISEETQGLHDDLTIVDLHADPLLWERDLLYPGDYGMVDVPRLIQGNVAVQVFTTVTKTPRGQNYESNSGDSDNITPLVIAQQWPVRTWSSILERALYQSDRLTHLADRSGGRLTTLRSKADLDRLVARRQAGEKVTGALLGMEGAQPMEGRLENLQVLFDAGFRVIGLVHFFDNAVAGSMHGIDKYGLTDLGRKTVQSAEDLGMIIDLAHASDTAFSETLAMARYPVIVSHGGVKGTCDTPRNLTDAQLAALAANGGMIGIGYWGAAVCDATPFGIVRSIRYVADKVGIAHVGLGSDFDGAVLTYLDTSELAAITQALIFDGFEENDIRAIMGGNALRLMQARLPQ